MGAVTIALREHLNCERRRRDTTLLAQDLHAISQRCPLLLAPESAAVQPRGIAARRARVAQVIFSVRTIRKHRRLAHADLKANLEALCIHALACMSWRSCLPVRMGGIIEMNRGCVYEPISWSRLWDFQ